MLLTSRPRRRVINVPLMWLGGALVFGAAFMGVPLGRHHIWGLIGPGVFLVIAAASFRVATRIDNRILLRGLFGRQWMPTSSTFLGVTTRPSYRGGGSITVDLMSGSVFDLNTAHTTLARYVPLGLEKPMLDARRIAEALGMGPPRLAPWLAPGGAAAVAAAPEGRRGLAGISIGWFKVSALFGLFVIGVGGAVVRRHASSGSQAELYLRCRAVHQIKIPIGELTLTRSREFDLPPGEATVEVWNRELACWTRRTLTLKAGVKTILDLDGLVGLDRCDRRGPPP